MPRVEIGDQKDLKQSIDSGGGRILGGRRILGRKPRAGSWAYVRGEEQFGAKLIDEA